MFLTDYLSLEQFRKKALTALWFELSTLPIFWKAESLTQVSNCHETSEVNQMISLILTAGRLVCPHLSSLLQHLTAASQQHEP